MKTCLGEVPREVRLKEAKARDKLRDKLRETSPISPPLFKEIRLKYTRGGTPPSVN
jgi:hypothetical protein